MGPSETKTSSKKVAKAVSNHKPKFKEIQKEQSVTEKINDDPNAPRINIKDLTNMTIAQLKDKAVEMGVTFEENLNTMRKQSIIFDI